MIFDLVEWIAVVLAWVATVTFVVLFGLIPMVQRRTYARRTTSNREIIAYRVLRWDYQLHQPVTNGQFSHMGGGEAKPVSHTEPVEAECQSCPISPGIPCRSSAIGYGCGFYAYKSYRDASLRRWMNGGTGVVVRVRLSGRVVEHERGYRAQFMTLDTVYPATPEFTDRRADTYDGCSCWEHATGNPLPSIMKVMYDPTHLYTPEQIRLAQVIERAWLSGQMSAIEAQAKIFRIISDS